MVFYSRAPAQNLNRAEEQRKIQQQIFQKTIAGASPSKKINVRAGFKDLASLQFPDDLSKYQFIIIETTLGSGGQVQGKLTFDSVYRLPIPTPLTEQYQVDFDEHQNAGAIANALANLLPSNSGSSTLDAAAQTVGGLFKSGESALGISLNSFKSVTLKVPSFRKHELNWKFSPKNFHESEKIKKILFGLKSGMQVTTPLKAGATNLVFGFPKVYLMFFVPNLQYLYKFKPCVLELLQIDYQGGNHAPAFFAGQSGARQGVDFGVDNNNQIQTADYTPGQNPPESIIVRSRWLELEYWVQDNFKDSNDPFDAISWFNR